MPVVLGSKEPSIPFGSGYGKGVFTVMSIAPAVPPGKDPSAPPASAGPTRMRIRKSSPKAFAYAAKESKT